MNQPPDAPDTPTPSAATMPIALSPHDAPHPPHAHALEPIERQRTNILRVVRSAFFVLILTIGITNAPAVTVGLELPWWVPVATAVILWGIGVSVDLLTPRKKISAISGVFLGIFVGLLATVSLGAIIDLLIKTAMEETSWKSLLPFVSVVKVMIGITLCYLGITVVLQTQDDFRLVIPYVEFAKQIRGAKPLVLDSSVLIDGRIVEVVSTGIVQAPVVVPRFIVSELQLLADSPDRIRRGKGRRGLDVVARLQRTVLDVTIDETPVPGKAVDQMLVELARRMPAIMVSTDTGLLSVAQIEGVSVLNLNKVAEALRPPVFPGESIAVTLVKRGEQAGQGVGYLEDGTMVVIDNGAASIGQEVSAEVSSSLQTTAGRMIFARLPGEPAAAPSSQVEEPTPTADAAPPAPPLPERTGPFPPQRPSRTITGRNPRR